MSEGCVICPFGANAQQVAAVPKWSWVARAVGLFILSLCFAACAKKPDSNTLVMIIESSPTNLDPRVGLDAQSECIDGLLFDDLFTRDEHLNVQPGLVERWEMPDPLTYVFHLRSRVRFHNGQSLTSRDVKWTFDSLLQGTILSTKAAAYRFVDHIEAPDASTVIFHLKEPDAPLLWNLSDGAIGIIPYASGAEISRHPIGSGPFRFVSAEQDKNVIIERNDDYWGQKANLKRVRFDVVPDATTQALELRKGSADISSINSLTDDMVLTLERESRLSVLHTPGTRLAYIGFNVRDPILKDVRVRQAIAEAIDRRPIIHYLLRDFARPAYSILPPESWAYSDVSAHQFDPQNARQLLDAAGYREVNGIRFHLTMETSTDESTRLLVAVLQQQLRDVGIALDIRTFEFATFFSDVTRGAFQLYSLRWIGGNEDPDIFEYVFDTSRFTPKGANRSFYSNPRLDALIDQARRESDQNTRKQLYTEIQAILAADVPSINLWYFDNVLVHSKRVQNVTLNPSGNYDFLKTATITNTH